MSKTLTPLDTSLSDAYDGNRSMETTDGKAIIASSVEVYDLREQVRLMKEQVMEAQDESRRARLLCQQVRKELHELVHTETTKETSETYCSIAALLSNTNSLVEKFALFEKYLREKVTEEMARQSTELVANAQQAAEGCAAQVADDIRNVLVSFKGELTSVRSLAESASESVAMCHDRQAKTDANIMSIKVEVQAEAELQRSQVSDSLSRLRNQQSSSAQAIADATNRIEAIEDGLGKDTGKKLTSELVARVDRLEALLSSQADTGVSSSTLLKRSVADLSIRLDDIAQTQKEAKDAQLKEARAARQHGEELIEASAANLKTAIGSEHTSLKRRIDALEAHPVIIGDTAPAESEASLNALRRLFEHEVTKNEQLGDDYQTQFRAISGKIAKLESNSTTEAGTIQELLTKLEGNASAIARLTARVNETSTTVGAPPSSDELNTWKRKTEADMRLQVSNLAAHLSDQHQQDGALSAKQQTELRQAIREASEAAELSRAGVATLTSKLESVAKQSTLAAQSAVDRAAESQRVTWDRIAQLEEKNKTQHDGLERSKRALGDEIAEIRQAVEQQTANFGADKKALKVQILEEIKGLVPAESLQNDLNAINRKLSLSEASIATVTVKLSTITGNCQHQEAKIDTLQTGLEALHGRILKEREPIVSTQTVLQRKIDELELSMGDDMRQVRQLLNDTQTQIKSDLRETLKRVNETTAETGSRLQGIDLSVSSLAHKLSKVTESFEVSSKSCDLKLEAQRTTAAEALQDLGRTVQELRLGLKQQATDHAISSTKALTDIASLATSVTQLEQKCNQLEGEHQHFRKGLHDLELDKSNHKLDIEEMKKASASHGNRLDAACSSLITKFESGQRESLGKITQMESVVAFGLQSLDAKSTHSLRHTTEQLFKVFRAQSSCSNDDNVHTVCVEYFRKWQQYALVKRQRASHATIAKAREDAAKARHLAKKVSEEASVLARRMDMLSGAESDGFTIGDEEKALLGTDPKLALTRSAQKLLLGEAGGSFNALLRALVAFVLFVDHDQRRQDTDADTLSNWVRLIDEEIRKVQRFLRPPFK